MKPHVYLSLPLPQSAMERIRSSCELEVWNGDGEAPREVLLERVKDVEGLIVDADKVDAELLDKAPRLKVVSEYGVGYDNIDVAEATRRGVLVGNTPGVLSETTADLAFALLLAAARRVVEGNSSVHAGSWGSTLQYGQDVHGATLGIIGLGRIGKAVAARAKGFGMKLLYYDIVRQKQAEDEIGVKFMTLDDLLAQSDFITIHANLVPETFHLIGAKELGKVKRTCILVNASRGPIVDNMALYAALRDGKMLGAGLDVTEPEPIPRDHPLLALKNVIITPHIGSGTEPARISIALLAVDNVIAGLKGQVPPGVVNPEVLKGKHG
ncbi:MAG: D-glycerate dehydrogenase [Candidatus Bathyarchaeia archaeon]